MTARLELVRPALRQYRTWLLDSRRWDHYRPRPGDIVVATYPKSGTTWTQRILALLTRRSAAVFAMDAAFPWWEMRLGRPSEALAATNRDDGSRRIIKTHLPLDGLPIYDGVRYVHVGRDGRDVCLAYHNHCTGFTAETVAEMSACGRADELIGKDYPGIEEDPDRFFHVWLTQGAVAGQAEGLPFLSYFAYEKTWQPAFDDARFLFLHYAGLKRHFAEEVRTLARFIGEPVDDAFVDFVKEQTSLQKMRAISDELIPNVGRTFREGARRLFNKGQIGGWHTAFSAANSELFLRKLEAALDPRYAQWLLSGKRTPQREP